MTDYKLKNQSEEIRRLNQIISDLKEENNGLQIEINAMKLQNKVTISDVHEGKKGTLVGSRVTKKGTLVGSRVPMKLTSAKYRTLSCILLGPISNSSQKLVKSANAKNKEFERQ